MTQPNPSEPPEFDCGRTDPHAAHREIGTMLGAYYELECRGSTQPNHSEPLHEAARVRGRRRPSHPSHTHCNRVAATPATPDLDVETLQYALEAVDPVAFARDGTAALSREDADHFGYAHAIAAAYARLSSPTDEENR